MKNLFYRLSTNKKTYPVSDSRWMQVKTIAIDNFNKWDLRLGIDFFKFYLPSPIRVSTVFLGLDHNHWDDGPPILFETMIFDAPKLDGYQERYATYEEAMAGHQEAIKKLKSVY